MSGSSDDRLLRYEALVRAWAPRLDLVAPGDLKRLRTRHIEDSLQVLPLLAEAPEGFCIDVGSGAGFPGIPLALCGPSALKWRLLEPRKARAGFLEEAVRELELDCEVIVKSAEEAAHDERLAGAHVVAVARALAPPLAAWRLLKPLVQPGGRAVVFVGRAARIPEETGEVQGGLAIMTRRPGPA